MIEPENQSAVHRYDHPAMNTVFSLRIAGVDSEAGLRAAGACFRRLEQLEGMLSRYRDDSDVSRINALRAGEQLLIDEDTHDCLRLAMECGLATGGLFDVTLGARIEHRKGRNQSDPPALRGRIEVAPDRALVTCVEPGREIDLGGIGKGFALDRMAGVLGEHGITEALLSCAGSTMLALGERPWPVSLRGEGGAESWSLRGEALSASGTGFQGAHVLHPEEPEKADGYEFRRVWVIADCAARADAFSTAALLMNAAELAEFVSAIPPARRCLAERLEDGTLVSWDG